MFGRVNVSGDRGRTSRLWRGCNPDVIQNDPTHGMFFLDDFYDVEVLTTTGHTGGWAAVEVADGRAIQVDDENFGVIAIGGDDATTEDGLALYKTGATVMPAEGLIIGFETRVKLNTITTGCQLFAGLADATNDAAPVSAGALAVGLEDHVSFHTLDNTVVSFNSEKAANLSTTTTAHTLVEDTYVILGFRINELDSIEMYVDHTLTANNVDVSTDLTVDTTLRPCLANYAEGNDASLASFDWCAVGVWGA